MEKKFHLFLLISLMGILAWSAINPYKRLTWVLEVLPAVVGTVILLATYSRFRLTSISYFWIWFFSIILIVGGKYTYAQMPLFNWIRDTYELSRNHYDRFGHFFQGFTPAILTREVLLRTSPLKKGKWLFFIVCCICLAVSASYELIEWLSAEVSDEAADAFVGAQGDVWDAQKDMGLCLLGAFFSQILLGRRQDKLLKKLVYTHHD